jgi:DNA polymerase delta subunit 3
MVKTDTAEPEDDTRTGATSSMIRAEDDQAAMEAMMGMDMDVDMDMSDEESKPAKKPLSAKAGKGQVARKKRKVTRTVTETNAKGYTGKLAL